MPNSILGIPFSKLKENNIFIEKKKVNVDSRKQSRGILTVAKSIKEYPRFFLMS